MMREAGAETVPKTQPPRDTSTRDTGATLLTIGGFAAAFGVASCCALPLLLATAGVGSAWLAGIALLAAPHRPFLLGAAAVFLASGAGLVFRRQRAAGVCVPGGVCSRPAVRGLTVAGLIAGAALLAVGYLYV